MKVLVGSKNQVKIDAVRTAFAGVFPDEAWEIEGIAVESGVSEQPLDEEETVRGARNRAGALRKLGGADYYVGIEGGLTHAAGRWMECGWVIVLNNKNKEGIAASAKIMISDEAYSLMKENDHDLTDVCEKYFDVKNAGQKMGYIGLMTNGASSRSATYVEAVAYALAPFSHPEVFAKE